MSISSWGKRSRTYLGVKPYGVLKVKTNTLNCTQKLTESYCTVGNTNIAVAAFTNQHASHCFLINRNFYVVFRGRPTALEEFIHLVIREWVNLFYLLIILSAGKKNWYKRNEFEERPTTVFSWSQPSLYETSCLRFMFLEGFKKYCVDMLLMWMMELGCLGTCFFLFSISLIYKLPWGHGSE